MLTVKGIDGLKKGFDDMIVRVANQIRDVRAEIVNELVERLIENIPVWSGRTISSLWVDKLGQGLPAEAHPQRGGFAIEGKFHAEPRFGLTSQMPMGSEPMRGQAEAKARAQAMKARSFTIWDAPKIQVTISSVPWALIEQGKAPNPNKRGRNRAVVSQIALAAVRSKFAGILK